MVHWKRALAPVIAGLCWLGCTWVPQGTESTGAGGKGGGGAGGGSSTAGSSTGGGTAGGGAKTGAGGGGGTGGAPEACLVGATAGECIDIDRCTAGGVAIPGYCPGPFEIKCCVHGEVTCDPDSH